MHFDSLQAFFDMGGHGFYVWLAYGVTLLVLGANFLSVRWSLQRHRQDQDWASVVDGLDEGADE